MRHVASDGERLVVELTRRELETLYGCVVEAKEALREGEFSIRVGASHQHCRSWYQFDTV